MANRRGLGTGKGKGYYNIIGKDPKVHSQSAKGVKQPQKPTQLKNFNIGNRYTAKQLVDKHFKGNKNLITPNPISYGKLAPNVAYELSTGKGLYGEDVYGVTIVKIDKNGKTETLYDHSYPFQTKAKADKYIGQLKNLPDKDKDGIPDKFDCDPNDPERQDVKEQLSKIWDKTKEAGQKGLEASKEFSQKELQKAGELYREAKEKGKEEYPKVKEFLKKAGQKGVEATKTGLSKAKETVEEEVEAYKEKKAKEKEKMYEDIDHPYAQKLDRQEERVSKLQSQLEDAEGRRKDKIESELHGEQEELNRLHEKIANIDVMDLKDEQLKKLAVRFKDDSIFFPARNKYEDELLRRIRKRGELEKDIREAREEAKKISEGKSGGLFG